MAERWKQTTKVDGTITWINMELVVFVQAVSDARTEVRFADGQTVFVTETPATLMAV
jgi:hypothetical protein